MVAELVVRVNVDGCEPECGTAAAVADARRSAGTEVGPNWEQIELSAGTPALQWPSSGNPVRSG